MAFTKKKIDLTFKLGTGAFGESGYDTVKVSNLRVQANIANPGGVSMGSASVRVYGLTSSLMNQLVSVSRNIDGQITMRFNEMQIDAGDEVSGMSHVFAGQMAVSLIDMSNAPDVALDITAHAGLLEAVKTISPRSYSGSADAAIIMASLAEENGYAFENNGVSVILSTPYFWGSPREQMKSCARAGNFNWTIETGTLAIWPKGGSRGGAVPLVSTDNGMVGYPVFSSVGGVSVRTLFNPLLQVGRKCRVESSLIHATGTYSMFNVSHEIESETPNGKWFTTFEGVPVQ